ncbi:unnamed protein product [Lampetra fluviatilis]
MAEQRQQPAIIQHLIQCWEKIAKSVPLSTGFAALLMTGLQEVFNQITNCPCSFGEEFGWVTLLAPIVILVVLLTILVCEALRARCGRGKGKRLVRYGALTFVASVAWVSVALLNSEAVCCIQGGFPSDSPCLAARNATANVVRYEDCTSISRVR